MAQKVGSHDISSLLATTDQSAVAFGVDTIAQVLAEDNAAHNALVTEALSDIATVTSDRQRKQGTSIDGEMMEMDEYGRTPTQKASAGQLVGFPMRKYGFALGWTRDWELNRTPADFAIAQQAAQGSNLKRIKYELLKALFTPTNYTYTDTFVDEAELAVKALINADSSAIQNGPNGETFDGATHTHYNANATLTAAAVQATIDDVVEHGFGGLVRVHISRTDEAAFRLLTGFVAAADPRLVLSVNADQSSARVDISRLDNRMIGFFGGAEVWTKPWVPANYLFASDVGSVAKPLVMRVPTVESGLRIVAEIDAHPLRAQYMEHKFGFGAWNRLNGAVLRFNNAAYAAPTITL